jgi:hypothetical protein
MRRIILAAIAALGLASSAQAVSYFSVGAIKDAAGVWRDPGVASFEQVVAGFDGGDAVGYDVDHSAGFSYTSGGAGAPAGDVSRYMRVEAGGSVLFDLRNYMDSRGLAALNISVYLGSLNTGNMIDVIGRDASGGLDLASPLKTITGAALTAGMDTSLVSSVNRRLYVDFLDSEQIGALRFSSSDHGFQLDSLAVSSVVYAIGAGQTTAAARPTASGWGTMLTAETSLLPFSAPVPEPSSWAMMLAGFGLVGGMIRRRRGAAALA